MEAWAQNIIPWFAIMIENSLGCISIGFALIFVGVEASDNQSTRYLCNFNI